MAKSTKMNSRKKWTLGGIGLFLGVALVTTASATYIIGINQTNQNPTVGVDVDTVKNNSVTFSMTVNEDSRLRVGETKNTSGDVVVVKDASETAMQVTFNVTIKYGEQYLADGETMTINYSFDYWSDATKSANAPLLVEDTEDAGDLLDIRGEIDKTVCSTEKGGTADRWTYVDAPDATKVPTESGNGWTVTTEGNVTTATAALTLTFKWGSFFDNLSPANFYNAQYDPSSITAEEAGNIEAELDAMYQALNTKDITLTAEITKAGA